MTRGMSLLNMDMMFALCCAAFAVILNLKGVGIGVGRMDEVISMMMDIKSIGSSAGEKKGGGDGGCQ